MHIIRLTKALMAVALLAACAPRAPIQTVQLSTNGHQPERMLIQLTYAMESDAFEKPFVTALRERLWACGVRTAVTTEYKVRKGETRGGRWVMVEARELARLKPDTALQVDGLRVRQFNDGSSTTEIELTLTRVKEKDVLWKAKTSFLRGVNPAETDQIGTGWADRIVNHLVADGVLSRCKAAAGQGGADQAPPPTNSR